MTDLYKTWLNKKKRKKTIKLTEEEVAEHSKKYRDLQDKLHGRLTDDEYDAETCPTCGNNPHD